MDIAQRINRISPQLSSRSYRSSLGLPPISEGKRVRIHDGWNIDAAHWASFTREDRHLVRILAVHRSARSRPVFSHVSAAVLLNLPVYGEPGNDVHTIVGPHGSHRRSNGLLRHRTGLAGDEIVEVNGLLCTSPDRTIIDLCRTETAERALACVDGYLRSEFRVGRLIDEQRLGEWRQDMEQRMHDARGVRGARSARRVLELAEARTDSPLESVSHLQLHRLGFEVELQVPVPGPARNTYYIDFEMLGLDIYGECDGKVKYLDSALRRGRSADEAVYDEKRRADWVCSTMGKRLVRWGAPEAATVQRLARQLHAFHVPIPRPPW